MTRLAVIFSAIACLSLLGGCGHHQVPGPVVAPPGAVAPWQGLVRLAAAGGAAFDAETEREIPRRIIHAMLSGIAVRAVVDCLGVESAGGRQAVHAVMRVGFAAGTTHEQRQRAEALLRSLAPQAEAYGKYLDEQQSQGLVSLAGAAEVFDRGRTVD